MQGVALPPVPEGGEADEVRRLQAEAELNPHLGVPFEDKGLQLPAGDVAAPGVPPVLYEVLPTPPETPPVDDADLVSADPGPSASPPPPEGASAMGGPGGTAV